MGQKSRNPSAALPPDFASDEDVLPAVPGQNNGAGDDDSCDTIPGDEQGLSDVDLAIVQECAALDASDTDNGLRLRRHFGADLQVMTQEGVINGDYLTWCGTHWDGLTGGDAARRVAQRIGARIALEADYLRHTPEEAKALAAAKHADAETEDGKALLKEAAAARKALKQRQNRRRAWGQTSKNVGKMETMLKAAAPHILRHPDDWNPDPLAFACETHTIRFMTRVEQEAQPPDYEKTKPVTFCRVEAVPGHRREDWITSVVPVRYEPAATCPKWDEFLQRFMPDAGARSALQVAFGSSLTGVMLQRFFLHYGKGANGKSVAMETVARILGGLGIGLPQESITGEGQNGGAQASPDIARLYGKRLIRILELDRGAPLKEALIKKLTGGEKLPARGLFKGFFEFQCVGKPHCSANEYPKTEGTDNGIWRRLTVFEWPVSLAQEEQEEFETVMAVFKPEYPGILNWLIEGARRFVEEGFVPPEGVTRVTGQYRAEMDPIADFVATCATRDEAKDERGDAVYAVTARQMYEAYWRWCIGNSKHKIHETAFGKRMPLYFPRTNERVRRYLHVRLDLEGLPPLPSASRNPENAQIFGSATPESM